MYTLNGYPIRDLRLMLPPKGLSVARVEYLSDEILSGAVTLANTEGDKCTFDVAQAGVFVWTGQALLRSAGALAKVLPAAHFRGVTVEAAVNDALSAAGVPRDRTVRGSTAPLNYWTRPESTGASELGALTHAAGPGYTWRVNLDGKVRFGLETWPVLADDFPAEVIAEWPAERTATIATERMKITPGVVWRGMRIEQVEYEFREDSGMRVTVWQL
jgi:hypothetical protein